MQNENIPSKLNISGLNTGSVIDIFFFKTVQDSNFQNKNLNTHGDDKSNASRNNIIFILGFCKHNSIMDDKKDLTADTIRLLSLTLTLWNSCQDDKNRIR